jgi:hypothetical protein
LCRKGLGRCEAVHIPTAICSPRKELSHRGRLLSPSDPKSGGMACRDGSASAGAHRLTRRSGWLIAKFRGYPWRRGHICRGRRVVKSKSGETEHGPF